MTSHVPPRLLAALYRAQDRVLAQPEPLEEIYQLEENDRASDNRDFSR
jgi:hypothetical protein